MIRAKTRNLIQAISMEGSVADRYFAATSEAPRNTGEARISEMPRNGRSARAGAERAADLLLSKVNGTLQPVGCEMTGSGVTGNSAAEMGHRRIGQRHKTIIARYRQL